MTLLAAQKHLYFCLNHIKFVYKILQWIKELLAGDNEVRFSDLWDGVQPSSKIKSISQMFHNNIRGNFHILFFLSNKFKAFQISIFTAGEHSSISVSQQKNTACFLITGHCYIQHYSHESRSMNRLEQSGTAFIFITGHLLFPAFRRKSAYTWLLSALFPL